MHRLTDIDPAAASATCAVCGPGSPVVYRPSRNQWLCRINKHRNDRARTRPNRPAVNRKHVLLSKYGLTLAQHDVLLAQQGGGCAICGSPAPADRALAVDHSHATGEVRGLLCLRCNTALGLLKEDPALILRAAHYLTAHTP